MGLWLIMYYSLSLSLQNNDTRTLADVKPRIVDEAVDKSRIWKLTEINEPSQCRSLKLPDSITVSPMRVRSDI